MGCGGTGGDRAVCVHRQDALVCRGPVGGKQIERGPFNFVVKRYVAGTAGRLTLHFLPGYAPDLNPDELVWSHAKRTGVARSPLRTG
jgi:hypothetical protein